MTQADRIAGVLLGAACGDALGVPYEFAARLGPSEEPEMIGGGLGPYEPGEYSDDTQMAVCIAQVSATGSDLRNEDALDGFVVTALQAAWSSIVQTPVPVAEDPAAGDPAAGDPGAGHLRSALATVIRIGDDTDTVAAIAGALLGARWGASALPPAWTSAVHGWPGLRAPDLIRLATLTAAGGGSP